LDIEEFDSKVDDLFRKVSVGQLTYEALKCELQVLCDKFENDLTEQDLTVESEEIESETLVFLVYD